jgi:hypothetical protein
VLGIADGLTVSGGEPFAGVRITVMESPRTLPADHAMLRAKARDRWFVPDPRKNADVEQLREKRLLEEFWSYLPPGYEAAARTRKPSEPVLPGMQQLPPKQPKGKRIAIVRTEAVRVERCGPTTTSGSSSWSFWESA